MKAILKVYFTIALAVSLTLFFRAVNVESAYLMLSAVFIMFISNMLYSSTRIVENMGFILINITTLILLVLRNVLNALLGNPLEKYFSDYLMYRYFKIMFYVYLGFLVGIAFVNIMKRFRFKRLEKPIILNLNDNKHYTEASKRIFYLSLPFFVVELILKIIFVFKYGYMSYYTSFGSSVYYQPIISKFADFYFVSFMIFLATFPDENTLRTPLKIFVLMQTLSMFMGQRNGFILSIIFLIWYMSIRQYKGFTKYNYFSNKNIIKFIVFSILLLFIINGFGYIRVGQEVENNNIIKILIEQGGSNHVMLRTFMLKDQIPEGYGIKFFFGPIIRFFSLNYFSQLLFGTKAYQQQTIEYALNSFNYGSYHTYLWDINTYLNGGGFGSSFVAEAYLAFREGGVFIFSLVMGIFSNLISKKKVENWKTASIYFIMIYYFFYVPRDSALYWVVAAINITNIFCIVLVYFYGNHLKNKKLRSH